jgi:hypothetical protein
LIYAVWFGQDYHETKRCEFNVSAKIEGVANLFFSAKKQRFFISVITKKDFNDNQESKILADSMDKDIEPLFCDVCKFPQCSVKTMGLTSDFIKVNVAINMTGDKTEVKSFLDAKIKEVKDKEWINTKAKVKNEVIIEGLTFFGKFNCTATKGWLLLSPMRVTPLHLYSLWTKINLEIWSAICTSGTL